MCLSVSLRARGTVSEDHPAVAGMSGLLLSGLVRCQQLVSLRAFMAPPALSLRHSWQAMPCWRQRQQGVQPPRQPEMQSRSGARQLHGGRWRCRAAAAAQPADDLSVNALKRREQELQSSVADAVRVRSMGQADRLVVGPTAARNPRSTLLPPVGCGGSLSSVLNAMPSPVLAPRSPPCRPLSSAWQGWRRQRALQTCGSSEPKRRRCCSS